MTTLSYLSSFAFQSPWALAALLLLAIPIAIHLINKSKAIRIKFANIRLIAAQKPRRMRQLRLTEFWLLLLRLLLLIVSILILAELVLSQVLISDKKIALVTHDWLKNTHIDERRSAIAQSDDRAWYLLDNNTIAVTAEQIISPKGLLDRVNKGQAKPQNTFNTYLALKDFEQRLSDKAELFVYSTDRASQYDGANWSFDSEIEWKIKSLSSQNTIEKYVEPFSVIIVYDEDRENDIRYFQAALKAIKAQHVPKLMVELITYSSSNFDAKRIDKSTLKRQPDWLFYFSSKPMSKALSELVIQGTHLFVDASLNDANLMLSKQIHIPKDSAKYLYNDIVISQRNKPYNLQETFHELDINAATEVIWQGSDAYNKVLPILTRQRMNIGNFAEPNLKDNPSKTTDIYQFYSRFSPVWSNLLIQKQFPLLLHSLLFEPWQMEQQQAQERLTTEQITSVSRDEQKTIIDGTDSHEKKVFNSKRYYANEEGNNVVIKFLSICMLILWGVERLLSELLLTKSSTNLSSQKQNDDKNIGHENIKHENPSPNIDKGET